MSKKLLLADDSITIQKVIGITFANEDYELAVVDNGDAALAKARESRPDLILADVFMPGMNGYELCTAIKQNPALQHVPVLLLTGTFEPFDEDKARLAGADSWIAKPFESQALIDRVDTLIREAAAAAPEVAEAPLAPVEELPAPAVSAEIPAAASWADLEVPSAAADTFPGAGPTEEDPWDSIAFDEQDLQPAAPELEEEFLLDDEELLAAPELAETSSVEPIAAEELPAGTAEPGSEFGDFAEQEQLGEESVAASAEEPAAAGPGEAVEWGDFAEYEPLEAADLGAAPVEEPAAAAEEPAIEWGDLAEEEPLETAELAVSPVEQPAAPAEESVFEWGDLAADEPLAMPELATTPEPPAGASPEEAVIEWGDMGGEEPPLAPELAPTLAAESTSEESGAVESPVVFGEAEAAAGEWGGELEDDILLLDDSDILEAEDLLEEGEVLADTLEMADPVETPAVEEGFGFAAEETAAAAADELLEADEIPAVVEPFGAEAETAEEELAAAAEPAYELDFAVSEFPVEESAFTEEVTAEPAAAATDLAAELKVSVADVLEKAESAVPLAEPVVEATAASPAPVAVAEERVAALSEAELERIVEKVAGAVVERLANTILEKIAWEVVPDLAESLIREEIRRIKERTA